MNIVKIDSSRIGDLGRRFVKFLRYGKNDVQEKMQVSPYGDDSSPIKDMAAVYAPTGEMGKEVIIGYINKNAIADPGEKRIFSTDMDGVVKTYIHLKNDGVMEVGGDQDFAARFNELKSGFDELRNDHNAFVSKYNLHVHPGVVVGPGSTIVTPSTESPSAASIDAAKIAEIKFP